MKVIIITKRNSLLKRIIKKLEEGCKYMKAEDFSNIIF